MRIERMLLNANLVWLFSEPSCWQYAMVAPFSKPSFWHHVKAASVMKIRIFSTMTRKGNV